jgi:hypothetical protein
MVGWLGVTTKTRKRTFVPEELEVETEGLHEQIHEELEHVGGSLLKAIALTTAPHTSLLTFRHLL